MVGAGTAEAVLVQAPGDAPRLTLRLVGPAGRMSVDTTGTQSWGLAGVLIDATVAHRQAVTNR